MSVNGDVSEQVIRLSLEGTEVFIKLTGSGAKNVAAMIYAVMKNKNQTIGKTKLSNMLKSGKPLKIFTLNKDDLKIFAKEAKKYGISYCALIDKSSKQTQNIVDLMVKEEDAARINRIVEKFKLTTVDTAKTGILDLKSTEKGKEEKDKTNFNMAKTEKYPLSEPSLKNFKMQDGVSEEVRKLSVKKELAKIEEELKILDKIKSKNKEAVNIKFCR